MTGPDNPGVRFPPPLLFATGIVVGYLVDRFEVALPITTDARWLAWRVAAGVTLMAVGVALAAWAIVTFRAARTAILPHKSASRVVEAGPFVYTRNPMYVGATITYVGVSAVLNSLVPLCLLPVVLRVLYLFVVRREERYLAAAFGATYHAYCQRVRRWL